jgi:hypothetical protein
VQENTLLRHVTEFTVVESSNTTSTAQAAAAVVVTSVCRISRRAGVLQLLRTEARRRNVHDIVLLQQSSALDAVLQATGTQGSSGQYAEAVFGSAASSTLTQQLRSAFDAQHTL